MVLRVGLNDTEKWKFLTGTSSIVEPVASGFTNYATAVAQLYPRALDSLYVASYDSQGNGGGILTRLHTGYDLYQILTGPIFKMKMLLAPLSTISLPLFLSLQGRYPPDRGSMFPEIFVLMYHIPRSYTPIDANIGPQRHGNIASSYVMSLFSIFF
jgi:hypothetical protein